MDFKLLACSSVAVASFSVLLFDYATYTPKLSAASPITVAAASQIVDPPLQSIPAGQSDTTFVAAEGLQSAPIVKLNPITAESKQRPASFQHPNIAGILKPGGLNRSDWTVTTSSPWVTDKPFDTQQLVVMLDPGHGGTDPGAIAANGLLEKHLTLDIAKRTQQYLAKYPNIDVQLSRDDDAGMSRSTRINKIRHSNADIVISLHFNDLPQKNIALVETYYAGKANIEDSLSRQKSHSHSHTHVDHSAQSLGNADFSFTQGSKLLAETLHKHVFGEVEYKNSAAHDAGVKSDTLFVLTQSYKTGALMELTCLSHPEEADKLLTDDYRNRLSQALADAILEYRHSRIKTPLIIHPNYSQPASLVNWTPADSNQRRILDPHSV